MVTLTLTIKCSNASTTVVTAESTDTVLQLKDRVSDALSVPASQQRLIYKGRVLKDDMQLDSYDVQDGHTVHMVKGAAAATTTATASTSVASAAVSAAPTSSGAFPNPFGAQQVGNNNVNRLQEQLMRSPDMMQQVLSSPMMDNLLNNPEMLRNMMLNNPQTQALLDSNPQVRQILNDPQVCLLLAPFLLLCCFSLI
jgi:ubiquilin